MTVITLCLALITLVFLLSTMRHNRKIRQMHTGHHACNCKCQSSGDDEVNATTTENGELRQAVSDPAISQPKAKLASFFNRLSGTIWLTISYGYLNKLFNTYLSWFSATGVTGQQHDLILFQCLQNFIAAFSNRQCCLCLSYLLNFLEFSFVDEYNEEIQNMFELINGILRHLSMWIFNILKLKAAITLKRTPKNLHPV